MSYLPKGIPGGSFSDYLAQERTKEDKRKQEGTSKYQGVFQDVEAHAQDLNHPSSAHQELLEKIKKGLGPAANNLQLVYRGTIDARTLGQPYPYGEKEGYFYIVEYGGSIGTHVVKSGDVLVRFDGFASYWTLVQKDESAYASEPWADLEVAKKISQKHLSALKQDLKKMPSAKTKAAPGPQKRKIVLEDD